MFDKFPPLRIGGKIWTNWNCYNFLEPLWKTIQRYNLFKNWYDKKLRKHCTDTKYDSQICTDTNFSITCIDTKRLKNCTDSIGFLRNAQTSNLFLKKLHIFKKIYIKNCIELLIGVIFPEFDVGVFWPKNAPIHEGNTSGAQRPRARTLRAQGCLESSEVGDTKFFRNLRHRQVHLVLYHFWSDSHGRGGTRELCLSFGTPGSDYAKTEEHSPS